jgi:hypothetical protein
MGLPSTNCTVTPISPSLTRAHSGACARLLLRHERARRDHPEVRLLQLAEHLVQHGVEGGVALGGARFGRVGLAHRVPVYPAQLRVVV